MRVKYKQLYNNDCGGCAINNLLSLYKIKKQCLISPEKNGISCYQIKKCLLRYFKKVDIVSFDINQLKKTKKFTPFIALLKRNDSSHYVVVYKKNKKYLFILDSICNISYKIKYKDFKKIDGNIAIIPEDIIHIYVDGKTNKLIFLMSFLSIFESIFTLSTAVLVQQIIDNGISDAILFIIVQILLLLILKYKTNVFLKLFKDLDNDLIFPTMIKIYQLKKTFIKAHDINEIYYRVNDAYNLKSMRLDYLFNFINDIILLSLCLLLVFVYSKIVFIFLVLIGIVVFIYSYTIYKKNIIFTERKRKNEYDFFNYYKESFNHVDEIYTKHNKEYENTSLSKLKKLQSSIYECEKLSILKNFNLALFQMIIICIVVLLYFTSLYTYLSIGSLIALINVISLCLQPMLNICSLLTNFSNYKLIKDRLNSINENT